jgi:hypothetical protein
MRDALGLGLGVGAIYLVVIVNYGFSPQATDVGYEPIQPVPYSHALHAGRLGMDCRYCHNTVEETSHAAIPPTQTCMGCHSKIKTDSPRLAAVRESYTTGNSVPWVKVHDLPDYVYFNHSAHVRRGVGCVECHGRIDTMEVVSQNQPLSMSWCLECHRAPDAHLRDPLEDRITDMTFQPPGGADRAAYGAKVRQKYNIKPSTDCSTCHH